MTRQCRDCGETKALAEFYSHYRKDAERRYYASYCRKCHAARNVRSTRARRYGLTVEEMDARLAKVEHCAICKESLDSSDAHFDHDHASGKLRDLLCSSCNLLLGHAHENVATLRSAVKYIQRHSKT